MDPILEKNLYLFKEHLGLIKAHNNYDIFDPESKEWPGFIRVVKS